MTAKRVFVVWTHLLFRDSVRLLLKDPSVDWLGETSDYSQAKEEVSRLDPDTIIVEETSSARSERILDILKACPERGRVLGVNLNNNLLNVYAHRVEMVGEAHDLLNVVLQKSTKGGEG